MDTKIIIIIGSSFFVMILLAFLSMFIVRYQKRVLAFTMEAELMKSSYEKTILQSQLEIQEQTFNTISQEIHDNVGQVLSLVKVQLNIMDERNNIDKSLLGDAQENISKAMTDLRDIAKGLSSERIRVVGLVATVEQEALRINRAGIVHISTLVSGIEQPTDSQKQLILFRIIQECLQNIIKHAAASAVTIQINYRADRMEIKIADNGKGFNFHKEQLAYQGLGLQNIFKRINLIGGQAFINSVLQEGTTIKLRLPYE